MTELIERGDCKVGGIRAAETNNTIELVYLPRVLANGGDAVTAVAKRFGAEIIGRTQPVNNYARSLNFGQQRVNNT